MQMNRSYSKKKKLYQDRKKCIINKHQLPQIIVGMKQVEEEGQVAKGGAAQQSKHTILPTYMDNN